MGGAGVIDQAARFLLVRVAAGVMPPPVFGAWSLILVIMQYAGILSLGVVTGGARSLPQARGARAGAEFAFYCESGRAV